ncbi:MAG: NifB/NifX family molybdenum-iron cluster-binding protein [Bacillota bacterium]
MKIAIPVDERSITSGVCPSFGRTPYYLLYDAQTKEPRFLENAAAQSQGGAGVKAAQILVDAGAAVLLTPRCGENAQEVLQQAGVQVYKTIPGTAQENIGAFADGQLDPLTEFHPGFHGHAH